MTKKLIKREALSQVFRWIDRPEVIAIKGPRQVGKTTLLEIIQNKLTKEKQVNPEDIHYFSFENRDIKEQFESDPLTFIDNLDNSKRVFVMLDEYQYINDGGQKLKLVYDKFKDEAKFIITGSSSLELTNSVAEYMVGRMFSLQLYPLSFAEKLRFEDKRVYNLWQERNQKIKNILFDSNQLQIKQLKNNPYEKQLQRYWEKYCLYGGYPAVTTAKDTETKKDILDQLLQTYIDRDIVKLLSKEDIKKFRDMVKMLAAQSGQILNYEQLADDTDTYFKKVKHFLSILEETYILKRLHPYYRNKTAELKKSPKAYLIDSGLRNSLLSNFSEVQFRADKGELIETVSLANITYSFQRKAEVNFWRTTSGAEVGFIVQKGTKLFPIEVKYKEMSSLNVSKSIVSFIESYEPKIFFVLTKGTWGRRNIENTEVLFIPVWYFGSTCGFWSK